MGLDVWLIPALMIFVFAVWVLYMITKYAGGNGIRSDGRIVMDKHVEEDERFKSD